MVSNIDTAANVITARGAGNLEPTPVQYGNQVTLYRYWGVHFEATFRLTEPTPYSVTNGAMFTYTSSNLKLLGPGGQTVAFPTSPKTYEGVLGAGDWTVLATGAPGGPDAGVPFNFTVALPEPPVGVVAGAGIVVAGGRRRRRA
jgi:hypothetical protein